jgi:hypothetical protein
VLIAISASDSGGSASASILPDTARPGQSPGKGWLPPSGRKSKPFNAQRLSGGGRTVE